MMEPADGGGGVTQGEGAVEEKLPAPWPTGGGGGGGGDDSGAGTGAVVSAGTEFEQG